MSAARSDDAAIAVLTVSYGSRDVLAGFLDSVPAAAAAPVRVVVADNLPSDPVDDLAAAHGADYLPLPANPGYGGAMNAAAATLPAAVRWILVSNPDVVLRPGSIDRLVADAEADPGIGAVGPAILTPEGDVYPSARKVPSLRTGIGHALFANIWIGNPWTRAYREESRPERRDAGWLSGACVLVRRSAFEQLGGFDDRYFMYFEDVDLGYRLGRAGYRNVYEPAAVVEHSGAHSTATDAESARMIAAHHRSARRFVRRKYAGWWLWPVRVALDTGLMVRSAILGRRAASR
jgi:N-acetylglucosaminyl-diphospho-decaprenol L-rhamnosyltransferase